FIEICFWACMHCCMFVYSQVFSTWQGFLFETTEGGYDWKAISPNMLGVESVYAARSGSLFITASPPGYNNITRFQEPPVGSLYLSRDDGTSWQSVSLHFNFPFGF